MSWSSVAKALVVQGRIFLHEGWNVPAVFMKSLTEAAMKQHEAGAAPAKSLQSLSDILFAGCDWVRKKLPKVKRMRCVDCGERPDTVHRPKRVCGEEKPSLKHVFCEACYRQKYHAARRHCCADDVPVVSEASDKSGDLALESLVFASDSDSCSSSASALDGDEPSVLEASIELDEDQVGVSEALSTPDVSVMESGRSDACSCVHSWRDGDVAGSHSCVAMHESFTDSVRACASDSRGELGNVESRSLKRLRFLHGERFPGNVRCASLGSDQCIGSPDDQLI